MDNASVMPQAQAYYTDYTFAYDMSSPQLVLPVYTAPAAGAPATPPPQTQSVATSPSQGSATTSPHTAVPSPTTDKQQQPGMLVAGHPSVPSSSRPIDPKARLGKNEVQLLEREFQRNNKPSTQRKKELANRLRMDMARVNNWFQNRRAKAKQRQRLGVSASSGENGDSGYTAVIPDAVSPSTPSFVDASAASVPYDYPLATTTLDLDLGLDGTAAASSSYGTFTAALHDNDLEASTAIAAGPQHQHQHQQAQHDLSGACDGLPYLSPSSATGSSPGAVSMPSPLSAMSAPATFATTSASYTGLSSAPMPSAANQANTNSLVQLKVPPPPSNLASRRNKGIPALLHRHEQQRHGRAFDGPKTAAVDFVRSYSSNGYCSSGGAYNGSNNNDGCQNQMYVPPPPPIRRIASANGLSFSSSLHDNNNNNNHSESAFYGLAAQTALKTPPGTPGGVMVVPWGYNMAPVDAPPPPAVTHPLPQAPRPQPKRLPQQVQARPYRREDDALLMPSFGNGTLDGFAAVTGGCLPTAMTAATATATPAGDLYLVPAQQQQQQQPTVHHGGYFPADYLYIAGGESSSSGGCANNSGIIAQCLPYMPNMATGGGGGAAATATATLSFTPAVGFPQSTLPLLPPSSAMSPAASAAVATALLRRTASHNSMATNSYQGRQFQFAQNVTPDDFMR